MTLLVDGKTTPSTAHNPLADVRPVKRAPGESETDLRRASRLVASAALAAVLIAVFQALNLF